MAAGLGVLRLAPKAFWSMTPKEFEAALNGLFGKGETGGAPSRFDLEELMQRFPDQEGRKWMT